MPEGQGPRGGVPSGAAPEGQGRLIGRRYRLLSPVGRGGMGMVWHAHDVLLDRDVAVKELILPFGLDHAGAQTAHRRMLREARSAARLSHPGIVTVHDVVEEDGQPWIVMELVRAWSLEQAVRQSGPLPVVQAAEIGVRVLDALRHAHAAGIFHRDVKPGNVLLTADRVVLTDFGIAAIEGDVAITQTGLLMGSPAYIPPERLQGRPITHAADLWSFGATLYAAVEGRPPYEGPDAVAVLGAVLTQEPNRPQRAGALLPVIEGLLRKNPADRLPAAQVADMLERVLQGLGAGPRGRAAKPASMPTPQNSTPAGLLPPLDIPSGPLPSRIIETPSGPVRVPFMPDDGTGPDPQAAQSGASGAHPLSGPASMSGPQAMAAFDAFSSPSGSSHAPERLKEGMWPTPAPQDLPGGLGAGPADGGVSGEWPSGEWSDAISGGAGSRARSHGGRTPGGRSHGASGSHSASPSPRRRGNRADAEDERDIRSKILLGVAGVAVIGVVVTVLLVLLPNGSEEGERPTAAGQAQASTAPRAPGTAAQQPLAAAEAPKGYTTRTEGDVSVAVPKEWTATAQDGAAVFSGPRDSGQRIKVTKIADGSLSALRTAEQSLNIRDYPDYTQIQLREASYRWPAADWEYTYTNSQQVTIHAITRYLEAGGQAYAVTFTSPDYDWNEAAEPVRQALWSTFTPA
ncbi:protein kinase [Microbispora sp. NPDC049125]|uniref:serine/threonine protein kinase n=1 Tax=Microbispora sp. NPDC049125 TaxID=3154929 RepID=UPI00346774DB